MVFHIVGIESELGAHSDIPSVFLLFSLNFYVMKRIMPT